MCRAFVGISLIDDNKARQDMKSMAMNMMANGYDSHNKDGFFISTWNNTDEPDLYIRSMEFIDTMKQMYNPKKDFGLVFHGHARSPSAGGATQEFVHGWQMHEYTCSHNGTVYIDSKEVQCENDSLSLFRLIDKVYSPNPVEFAKNIRDLVDKVVEGGTGVFFMVSKETTIAFSINKDLTIHLIDDRYIELNSQDDVHRFKDEQVYTWESANQPAGKKLGLLDLKQDNKRVTRVVFKTPFAFKESYSTDFKCKIIVMDNGTGEVSFMDDIGKTTPYGRPAKNYSQGSSYNHNNGWQGHGGASKKGVAIEVGEETDGETAELTHVEEEMSKYMSMKELLQAELSDEKKMSSKSPSHEELGLI